MRGETMMEVVRLGVIGLGQQGGYYAELLAQGKVKNMILGAICVSDLVKNQSAIEKFPEVPIFDHYIECLRAMLLMQLLSVFHTIFIQKWEWRL
jgi:predicted dehydrogenase